MTKTQRKIVRKINVLCAKFNSGAVCGFEFNRQLSLRLASARQVGLVD